MRFPTICLLLFALLVQPFIAARADDPKIAFEDKSGKLVITIGDKTFGTYVYRGEKIPRPYFENVYAPNGVKATRNYPTLAGDQEDHPHHPGIFFTFGDMNGFDYWHLKGRTIHERFVVEPRVGKGKATFTVKNRYLPPTGDDTVCSETCRYTLRVTQRGYRLEMDTELTAADHDIHIGSKEEGGLAVRIATPLCVENGGTMHDDQGRMNEDQIWSKPAAWLDYSGPIEGQHVGILLMTHPDNFSKSWWHARDYGVFAANPFGPLNAPNKKTPIRNGESLHLRFAVLVHSHPQKSDFHASRAYVDYLRDSKQAK